MAITVSEIQEFTNAEILRALRSALVNAATAQSYSYGGVSLSRMNAKDIQALIEIYEAKVEQDSLRPASRTGVRLARFVQPR